MNPYAGVVLELLALACVLAISPLLPTGWVFGVYVVVAELLATYLVHCPAHFIMGTIVGVEFRSIGYGRSTLVRALPQRLAGLAKPLPILTLKIAKVSLSRISKGRAASMYAAGTVASVATAFLIALLALPRDPLPFSALAWAVAIGYLLFDVAFSPRSGDLARARKALRP